MSYTIDFVVPQLPQENEAAWESAQAIIDNEPEDCLQPHPALVRLHEVITSVYPCLSSYERDDPAIDSCPWSDGPLMQNFGLQSGRIGMQDVPGFDDILSFVTGCALALDITVLDEQTSRIKRPDNGPAKALTYRLFVRGVQPGLQPEQVAAKVARRFNCEQSAVLALLTQKGNFNKGLDLLSAIRDVELLSNAGCLCVISQEQRILPDGSLEPW